MKGELKVIGSPSSLFCTRIEWALKIKGVEYEYIEEDLRNKSPILLKYNPVHKKVPVLVHDENPIAESLVILEYIDETWKDTPLMPQDPNDRALARFWAKFGDDKCLLGAFAACWQQGEEQRKAVECAVESFEYLEKQIHGKKFFSGEQIGYLDLAMGWIPHWLSVMEEVGRMNIVDAKKFPCLHQWTQDFIDIPLIKEPLPPRDKLVEYFHGSVSYMRSMAANKQ